MKLQGIVINKGDIEKHFFLHNKHTSALLSVQGTTLTVTVLAATEFNGFSMYVITLTPLILKTNTTVACRTFWCVTR